MEKFNEGSLITENFMESSQKRATRKFLKQFALSKKHKRADMGDLNRLIRLRPMQH